MNALRGPVGLAYCIKSRAEPSRAEPSRAEPSRAEPSRAEPSLYLRPGAALRHPYPDRAAEAMGRAASRSRERDARSARGRPRRLEFAARRPAASAFRSACLLALVLLLGAGAAQGQTPSVPQGCGTAGTTAFLNDFGAHDFTVTETTATFSYTNEVTATFDVCDSTGSTNSVTETFSSTVTSLTITGLTAGSDYWIRDRQGADFQTAWHHFRTSSADTTPPTFQSATVNGTALVITFNELLAAAASLANSAFTVKKTASGGSEQAVGLSGSPSISGATVTLTLTAAVVSADTGIKVSYAKPTAGTDNKLQDGSGNEVATFTDEWVTNELDMTAPTAVSATVNGDTVTITFNEEVVGTVRGVRFSFSVNGDSLSPYFTSIVVSGRTVIVTLQEAVTDTDTVVLRYSDAGNVNRLTDERGNVVASFTFDPVTNLTPDTAAPQFQSATVNGTALSVTFDEALDTTSAPAGSAFMVTATPSSGAARTINGTSAAVSISGAVVTVTLASAVAHGETVALAYTKPGTNPLRDTATTPNAVATFSGKTVTNQTNETDGTPPTFQSATVNGTALVITFNELLAAAASLANSAFTVKKTASGGSEQAVGLSGSPSISGATVTLTLTAAVVSADTGIKVSYAKPTAGTDNKLQDGSGNEVATFTDEWVTNELDMTAPTAVSATVNGDTVTITFNEEVVGTVRGVRFSFSVNGDSLSPYFTSIVVSGRTVIVTLQEAVTDTDTVVLRYSDAGNVNRLTDERGNVVASFTFDPVTNLTPDTAAPQFQSATVNGTALSVTFDEALDTASAPAGSAFMVTATPSSGAARTINGTSAAVSISGAVVTVTLASAVAHGETVALAYTKLGTNPLRDTATTPNAVATFSSKTVTNQTPPPWPLATGATVNGKTLTIAFDKDLDTAQAPAANRFRYTREGETDFHNPHSVAMAARTVTLTLQHTVSFREAITVRYLAPASGGLRGADGHVTRDFALDNVTNETPDTTSPQPVEAYTVPQGVGIRFTEFLVTANLSKTDFTVKVDGAVRAQTAKPIASTELLLLRLSPAIAHGETATVSYSGGTALKDVRLNSVQPFTDFPVESRAPAPASITSVAITSTPSHDADGDATPDTYRRWEKIEVTVTWDKEVSWDVSVSGTDIRVRLDVGGETQVANLVRGVTTTGTARSLRFRYRVQATDGDTDGVFPKPNAVGDLVLLVGAATLAAADGESAQVAHAALPANANHKVDGT